MTQNAEDFNRILNEINTKIDYMASHNDKQAIDALLNQVKTLEKTFNDSLLNFNFEKQTIFENIQREITNIIEKSTILKDLFPQQDNEKFEKVENTINSNLSRVHTDLSDTIKQDFNAVAQGIGALYSKIEAFKTKLDETDIESVKQDINTIGNKMIEIRNELKSVSSENVTAIIDNIKQNNANLTEIGTSVSGNLGVINDNIQRNNENTIALQTQFEQNLNTIRDDIQKSSEQTDEIKTQITDNFNSVIEEIQKSDSDINQLKSDLRENITSVVERIDNSNETLNELKSDINGNITSVAEKIDNSNENLNEFKQNIADNLTGYLASIKDLFVSFSDEIHVHQESISSDAFDKKVREFDIISKDIRELSSLLSLKEENYKEILNGKILELYNYLKTLEEVLSSSNISIGNSISEITDIKNYIANTALKLDDIYANLSSELNNGSEKIDELKDIVTSRFSSVDSKLYTIEDNLVKELGGKVSVMEQIRDDMGTSVNTNFNEIKTILECMRANTTQTSGNISEKLDTVNQKVSSDIEIIIGKVNEISDKTSIYSAETKDFTEHKFEVIQSYLTSLETILASSTVNLDSSMGEITEIKEYIANTSLKLDDIGANVSENLTGCNENIDEIKNLFTQRLEAINSKLYTMEDNLAKEIAGKISEFEQTKDDSTVTVNNNINELKTIIECLRANISQNSSNVSENISEFKNVLNEKFTEFTNSNEEQKTTSDEIKFLINNVSSEITRTKEIISEIKIPENDNSLSTDLSEVKEAVNNLTDNSTYVSDKINDFGSTFTEKFADLYNSNEEQKINTSEIKSLLNSITEEIEKTRGNINETLSYNAKGRDDIFARIEDVKDHISAIKLAIADLNTENSDKLTEKLFAIESKLFDSKESYEQHLTQLQDKLSEYINNVELISEETNSKLENSAAEFSDIKSNLNEIQDKLTYLNTDQKSFLEENLASIIEKLGTVTEDLTSHRDEIKTDMKEVVRENINFVDKGLEYLTMTLDELKTRQAETVDDITNTVSDKLNDIKQEIELLNTDVTDVYQAKSEAIIKEFEPLKSAIFDFTSFDFNEIITEIKNQIEISYLNLLQELNKNLIENHDTYINIENTYKDVVSRCASLQECIDDFTKNNLELINSTIAGLDLNVRSSLEKTDNFLSEWKTYASGLERKITENGSEIEHSLLNILDELQKTIDEKVKAGSSELKDFFAVMLNNEDLMITLESMNGDIVKQIETIKETLDSKNDKIENSVLNIERNINEKFSALQLELMDKPDENEQLNTFRNALKEIQSTLTEKFESSLKEINSKVDIIAMNDDSELREEISELAESISKSSETDSKISEMLDALHSKVDILAMSDDSELRDEISDVKDLIYEQRKLFESFDDNKKAQEIENYLNNLLTEINKIDLEKNTQDIKDSVMSAILSVTDQVSFVEETEEIKDFVEEKTNAINQTLLDVKKQLNNIASSNSDMDFYSYTLQDVESDLAKLRLAMNEISSSNSTDEVSVISSNINRIAKSIEDLRTTFSSEQSEEMHGDLDKLNEDILSLSARTNKLLLNSDESYRVICDSMEEFNRRTYSLQEQLDKINAKALEKQLTQIDQKVNATMSSSKVLQNVMMYLGEWMDGTTELVNSIYEKTSKTTSIQEALDDLKQNVPQKQELLGIIENKFEEQQSRIDRLEMKLEKAITMLEEREADTVQNKIDNIETQLTKLSSNIEKLTSYVDE